MKVALSAPVALASAPIAAVVNTQVLIHFNESSTFQLINGISHDLQRLFKYFSGTTIFTPFFVPSVSALTIRLALYLIEGASLSLVTFALPVISSLLKPYKLPEVSEQLSLYSIKFYIGIVIPIKSVSSAKVSFISVLQFLNGA